MKVMLVIPEYPPYNIGGGGVVYKNLAYHLKKIGIDVVVMWGFYGSKSLFDKVHKYVEEGIVFYMIPEIPYPKNFPYLKTAMPPNLNGLLSIPKIIRRERPDIIHLHGYGLPFINIVAFWSNIFGIPTIFTIHGYPKTPEKKILSNILWKIYEKTIMKLTLDNAKIITCVSKWLAEDKRLRKYRNKVKIIYNGIDIEKLRELYNKSESASKINIKEFLGLPSDSVILCSVGRISEMKGFQLVIRALPKLLKVYPHIYYVIIGSDYGYKKELWKLAKELNVENRVIFTGFLSEYLKLEFIRQCNVFMVPSIWEPFGLTAPEGIAMRKIVITTGAGGLKEVLQGCKNVIFFKKEYIDSLVEAILSVLKGKIKYEANDKCLEKFSWNNIVREYVEIYKQVLGG